MKEYQDSIYVIIEQGYYFGEIDFIYFDPQTNQNNGRRKFAAIAIEECNLLVLSKEDLLLVD